MPLFLSQSSQDAFEYVVRHNQLDGLLDGAEAMRQMGKEPGVITAIVKDDWPTVRIYPYWPERNDFMYALIEGEDDETTDREIERYTEAVDKAVGAGPIHVEET
jgi:hypothetical protein